MAVMPRALLRLLAASVLAGLAFAGLPLTGLPGLTEAAGAAPARAVFMLGDSVMLGSKAATEKELAGWDLTFDAAVNRSTHCRRADRHQPALRDPRHHRHPARDQRRRQPDDVREPGRRRDEGARRRPLRRVADHPRSPAVLQERQRRPAPEGDPVPEHARRRLERRRERDARRHGERRPPPQRDRRGRDGQARAQHDRRHLRELRRRDRDARALSTVYRSERRLLHRHRAAGHTLHRVGSRATGCSTPRVTSSGSARRTWATSRP